MGGGIVKAIYLTGFMGVGKTTVGRALGERLKIDVIDLDAYIEQKLAWKISSIFERKGEVYFRDEEQSALQELPTENIIVTTGGGAVIRKENRCYMKEHGLVVYLDANVETIYNRLTRQDHRPLAKGKSMDELAQLAERRQPYYEDADVIIQTDGKTVAQIVRELYQWIKTTEIV
jgi:shikimate kinase